MELFGHDVNIKTQNCGFYDNTPTERDLDLIALFVRFKGCNASCTFCEYMDDASHFDLIKYREVLEYLKEKVWVHKINLTGGEPTLNWKLFKKLPLLYNFFPSSPQYYPLFSYPLYVHPE
jgi:pyruvate-formate lyase-activating enzyme